MDKSLEDLTDLFKRLGARDPEGWAASQINEDIPQLTRFLFLRQAWRQIVSEEDKNWPRENATTPDASSNRPYDGMSHALASLLEKGATQEELIDLVRGAQASLLFQICYLLNDPMLEEPELEDFGWGLFQVDREGVPVRPIEALHESVLETDPTGREMRPRQSDA